MLTLPPSLRSLHFLLRLSHRRHCSHPSRLPFCLHHSSPRHCTHRHRHHRLGVRLSSVQRRSRHWQARSVQ